MCYYFFFQAGDGIRDGHVTGVQTCALPIFRDYDPEQPYLLPPAPVDWLPDGHLAFFIHELMDHLDLSRIYADYDPERSEERRVGKECRARRGTRRLVQ